MPSKNDILLASHPIEIYNACNKLFEPDNWLAWEPDTLVIQLKNEITDTAADKLCAVQAVCSNANAVVRGAAAFEKTVNAFCNNICIMDVIQPPEIEEVSYAVSQIEMLIKAVHGSKTVVTYIDEVPSYVASVGKFRDWTLLPKNLSFAQNMLDTLTGMDKNSKLYKQHKEILETVTSFINTTTRKDAREILKSLEYLQTDDMASLIVKKFVGALLFDPTLPYR